MLKFLARGTALAAMIATSSLAHAETLKMWGPEQITEPLVAQLWNGIKADFEKANPGVTVEFTPPTGTISNGAVQAAIQSDAGPDVILTNSGIGRISVVKNAKQVMPLTEQYEKRGWKDQIYPWLYTELKGQFGGEIYEVPDGLDALGIWYHKDVFAQAGWKIPATWAEFETLMKAIEETGLQPIAIGPRTPGSAGHLFGNLLQSASGKEVIGKAMRREVAFDDPSIAAGAVRLQKLVEAGYIKKEMAGLDLDGASRLWFNKRAAMFVAGPWFTANARKAGYDLANAGYAPMPSDIKGAAIPTGGVGWSWLVPVNSKQPELAMKWIDFMLSDAAMKKRAQDPASTMIYPREIPGVEPPTPVLKDIFAAAAGGVGYNPSVYLPGTVLDTYFQVIQGLISGQIGGEDGMKQLQAKMAEAK
ncbi:extracellular solute-binding protein (plasmid) [Rhizobium bangladeshense]|uniref:ABC transporter substrate-binding protein n=1 Tax=Rhizobium bangladeshense TaxID=1138189 RepID=UPI001A98F4A8|nr:extracellular solute-binding protein [Rhizobium bangladeshense]QSY98378.1 extracellular solute-binding protein [Rhizobium bangladeshense]